MLVVNVRCDGEVEQLEEKAIMVSEMLSITEHH